MSKHLGSALVGPTGSGKVQLIKVETAVSVCDMTSLEGVGEAAASAYVASV